MVGLLKKYFYAFCFFLCCFFQVSFAGSGTDDLILRYTTDAKDTFTNAIPIGNGYMGGMVYGAVAKDKIGLNESTIWSDSPGENNAEGAYKYLAQVRSQIFAGNYKDADATVNKMIGGGNARFVPAGNLYLEFSGHTGTNYSRELNLKTAIAKTSYVYNGVTYTREYFASYPDKVIIVRLTASAAGKISFSAYMDSPLTGRTRSKPANNPVVLKAQVNAIKFQNRLTVKTDGGTVSSGSNKIIVSGANSATILLTIATNFNSYNDVSGNPDTRATAALNAAAAKTYDTLRENQQKDYTALFDRVDLNLGTETTQNLTTDARVSKFSTSNDPGLVRLYYQFGRYLMISCSRDGSQPANLQGIWNKDTYPTWGSKYTTNINLEMNYWMTETANLAECAKPFINKVKSLVPQGELTAKEHWGVSEGWVLHHNTDLWNHTAPIDGQWGLWPTGAGWLSAQLWDHYAFNPDLSYLADIYPTMKGAAQFFLNSMVTETVSGKGYLVTVPSASPEIQHGAYWTCFAPTMDNQIIRDVFTETLQLCHQLTDAPLLIRLDSGNDAAKNLGILIEDGSWFIVKQNLRRGESKDDWILLAKECCKDIRNPRDGKEVYVGSSWKDVTYTDDENNDKTMCMRIGYEIIERSIDKHGQFLLPADIEANTWWTNLGATDDEVIALYHAHGECEQYHSEIKTDMDVERLPSGKFETNELVLELTIIAYNILRMIGQESLKSKKAPKTKHVVKRRRRRTVISNLILIAGHITSHARKVVLALGCSNTWRYVFMDLFQKFALA